MGAVVPIQVNAGFVRPSDLPHTCSDEHLVFAVQEWLTGGSVEDVSKHLRVPKQQVSDWVRSRGWQAVADMVREDVRRVAHSHLTRITNKASTLLMERLNKGDPIVNENGKITGYRPVRARDLAFIQTQVLEQVELIEKRLGLNPDEADQMSLKKLNATLQRYAREHIIPNMKARTIDGTATVDRARVIDAGESEAGTADRADAEEGKVGDGSGGGVAAGPVPGDGRCAEREQPDDDDVEGRPGIVVEGEQRAVAAE